jgi:hypothetical protein
MKERFDDSLTIMLPTKVSEMVQTAASRRLTNSSNYVRQAVAKSLREDGFDLDAAMRVA